MGAKTKILNFEFCSVYIYIYILFNYIYNFLILIILICYRIVVASEPEASGQAEALDYFEKSHFSRPVI